MDNEQLKSNLLSADHWLRLVYMVLFAIVLYVAGIVMSVLVVVQFVFALVTGHDNTNLRQLGNSLSQYMYGALLFLTYNTDDKPFPFSDWPESTSAAATAPASDVQQEPASAPKAPPKAKAKAAPKAKAAAKKTSAKTAKDNTDSE